MKLNLKVVAESLRKNNGKVAVSAFELGISIRDLNRFINKHKTLLELQADILQLINEELELSLLQAAKTGNLSALNRYREFTDKKEKFSIDVLVETAEEKLLSTVRKEIPSMIKFALETKGGYCVQTPASKEDIKLELPTDLADDSN